MEVLYIMTVLLTGLFFLISCGKKIRKTLSITNNSDDTLLINIIPNYSNHATTYTVCPHETKEIHTYDAHTRLLGGGLVQHNEPCEFSDIRIVAANPKKKVLKDPCTEKNWIRHHMIFIFTNIQHENYELEISQGDIFEKSSERQRIKQLV